MQSDKLLTWATGGTPEGDLEKKPDKVDLSGALERRSSRPQTPDGYGVRDGGRRDRGDAEFVIPTGLHEQRWLKAVDLLPGSPEIVRNASISLENGAILAVWVPGDNLVSAPAGTAFRLPAGSKLRLQIHYKKQWQNEGKDHQGSQHRRSLLHTRSTFGPGDSVVTIAGPNGSSEPHVWRRSLRSKAVSWRCGLRWIASMERLPCRRSLRPARAFRC